LRTDSPTPERPKLSHCKAELFSWVPLPRPPTCIVIPMRYNSCMTQLINDIMERASQSLATMDYLASERDCLEALALARSQQDWRLYAAIILPLQECRRQRRMIAADGWVMLGSSSLTHPASLLEQ